MRTHRRVVVVLASVSVGIAAPFSASAQDFEETAAARVLFEEGVRLAEKGEWGEAADRFERTFALRPSPTVLYNLASARLALGELVAGTELLRRLAADERADPEIRRVARRRIDEVAPSIGRLRIRVEGAVHGAEMRLDGRRLSPALIGTPLPVDPGAHRIVVLREGRAVARAEAEIAEGESTDLRVQVPPPLDAEHVAREAFFATDRGLGADARNDPLSADSGRGLVREWWFWTGLGVIGAVGAIVIWSVLRSGGSGGNVVEGDFSPGVIEL